MHNQYTPRRRGRVFALAALGAIITGLATSSMAATSMLPGWQDGASKARIVQFVEAVTDPTSPDYVPPAERIAVFDNDGTLWSEQPMYFQLAFVLDRVKALAPQHPEWRTQEPFKSVLAGDMAGVAKAGEHGLLEMMAATHAGMTADEFRAIVADWLATARHPRFKQPYTELTYTPMKELLPTCVPTGSRRSSSREVASSSCACSANRCTACRPSTSSAAASARNTNCATASR